MLKLEKVSAYYGQVQALRHISLEVAEGEIVAVIHRAFEAGRCAGLPGPYIGSSENPCRGEQRRRK
jgi:ABC-type arginine transport system ATPase subunit